MIFAMAGKNSYCDIVPGYYWSLLSLITCNLHIYSFTGVYTSTMLMVVQHVGDFPIEDKLIDIQQHS